VSTRKVSVIAFLVRQLIEKKWESGQSMHQLFVDFRKAHNTVNGATMY